jgi:endonuclease/exonuclease/phosphatase family metal-dependent hydrolase
MGELVMIKQYRLFLLVSICTALSTCATTATEKYQNINSIKKGESTTRVMTFNVRREGKEPAQEYTWSERLPHIATLLKDIAPDIIGFQEAGDNQINDLQKILPNTYQWFGQGRKQGGIAGWFVSVDEHTPIFYNAKKFALIESGTFWLNPKKQKYKTGWGAWLNRICTWAHFKDKKTNKKLWVFNTHLDNKSERARVEGIKLILNEIKQKTNVTDPVILMGDFNAQSVTPESDIGAVIQQFKIINAKEIAQHTSGPTWTAFKKGWQGQTKTIDYIMINNANLFSIKNYMIPVPTHGKRVSDHNPVVIDLQLA